MIWIRPTLCDDGLLNGVYFLDPYPSRQFQHSSCLRFFCDVISAGRAGCGGRQDGVSCVGLWLPPEDHVHGGAQLVEA